MTDTKKKKTTTTAPPLTAAQQTLLNDEKALNGGGLGSVGGTAGVVGNVPSVTSTESADVVPFTLPNQKAAFTPAPGLTTKDAKGGTQMSFAQWVEEIHKLQSDKQALTTIQTELHAAGYLTNDWSNYGTLDSSTITAWKQLGTDAVDSSISATTLLAAGSNAPTLVSDMKAVQLKISSAREEAAQVTNSNVTLTDPNEIAQHYATAMESMGEGAPTKAQTAAFVAAFHNAEVSATQNEATAEKQNYLAGSGELTKTLDELKSGNLAAATAAENTPGPVMIATKAAPNIDAEAIAQAQAANPAGYMANDMTYGYSLLQKMLGGDMSLPATPSSPTSLTPSGAVVTTPLVGAAA